MRRAALSAARAARSLGHVVTKSGAEERLGGALPQAEAALLTGALGTACAASGICQGGLAPALLSSSR